MPNFKIMRESYQTNLSSEWVDSPKFNSKNRLVDENGKKISADFNGNCYQLICKKQRNFSTFEKVKRVCLGILAVAVTLGAASFLKSVQKLFTKKTESVRFGVLEENTPTFMEDGKLWYQRPKILYGGLDLGDNKELNFAQITQNRKTKLLAVTGSEISKKYTAYEGTPLDALLKLAQNPKERSSFSMGRCYDSPITHFLKHTDNTLVSEEEFFKFILEKDENGTPRICTLNDGCTLEVLKMLQEKNIPINLHEKTQQNETLFSLWVGKDQFEIVKTILEIDPTVIKKTQDPKKSVLIKAVLSGDEKEAHLILDAMEKVSIPLNEEEMWFKNAIKDDCNFSEKEFGKLPKELKEKIFYSANIFSSAKMVTKLKTLKMEEPPRFWPGPGIFARNMDVVTSRKVMEGFLKNLRKEKLLLSQQEFNQFDKTQYIEKVDQIGRILGRDFIEKIIKENGLKHIKAHKKIAVINEGLSKFSVGIGRNLEPHPEYNNLTVYAERIKPTDRKLSLEEAIEFMILLEKSGFNDFFGQNIFIAEDGIYIIDTEFTNFTPEDPSFGAIKSISDLLENPKDKEKFLIEYKKRKADFENNKKTRDKQSEDYQNYFENPYKRLTGSKRINFEFKLSEL